MIRLTKVIEPQYLTLRGAQWLADLNKAIILHGGYDAIPEKEKDRLISHYRHDNIKNALFPTSFNKCAFCECIPDEGGNFIQVEHFYPKSLYPMHCFSWDNFLPCCGRCNLSKSDLDTITQPIINPYVDDPCEHLHVSLLKIKGNPGAVMGENSVRELKLNNSRLIIARRNLLGEIENLTERVAEVMTEIQDSQTPRIRNNKIGKLLDLIDELEALMHPSHTYSFFCKQIILSEEEYRQAKLVLLSAS